jgi:hypothetical protein
MTPSPSEDILIRRILDALNDSGKTAVGISNYIKAKYYRIESSHEIKKVISKYLLNEKVQFEPYFEVYKLKTKSTTYLGENVPNSRWVNERKKRKKETKQSKILFIESPEIFNIPEKISFLNELYKRREKLMLLPIDERLNNKRLEIIETLSEIKELKPIATQIFIDLDFNSKLKVLNSLVPTLKNELRNEIKADDGIKEFQENIDNSSNSLPESKTESDLDDRSSQVTIVTKNIIISTPKNERDSAETKSTPNSSEIIKNENEPSETRLDSIPIESLIKLVTEEKIRLGKLDGNLLAENILYRIKKGKWD